MEFLAQFINNALSHSGALFTLSLSKEHAADCDGCHHSCKVCQQTASHGVTGVAHAYAAEVDGEDVEGGVGGALEDPWRNIPHERVGTIGGHGVHHFAWHRFLREAS